MHVLYFHQHFSTPKGSVGIRSYEMAKRLVASGHNVTMVCGSYDGGNTGISIPFANGKREGQVEGIKIVEFDLAYSNADGFFKRAKTFLSFALKSVGIALTKEYDLVFATTTPLTASIPGIFARWLRRKPFVFEVRDLWPELPREMGVIKNPAVLWAMGVLEWMAYKSATALVGLSPGIKSGIERHNIDPDRVAMIPNGCDLGIFSDIETKWQPEGVSDSDLMAVFTGTHGIANGLDIVIQTAHELQKRNRLDIKFVLIGEGKLKPELMTKAKELSLTNIIFHAPVNKKRLAELMARADIGLQLLANIPAFYYGTSPNKFFDYISAGLPVLTNYPGWLATIMEESGCGVAVKPDQPKEFADALEQLANNRDKLIIKGAASKKLAIAKFDRNMLSAEFVAWLEKWSGKC